MGQGGVQGVRDLPAGARSICLAALTIAAEGGKAAIVWPMHGLGSGVFETALPFKGDAFRVIYALQLARRDLGGACVPERIFVSRWGVDWEARRKDARKLRKAGASLAEIQDALGDSLGGASYAARSKERKQTT